MGRSRRARRQPPVGAKGPAFASVSQKSGAPQKPAAGRTRLWPEIKASAPLFGLFVMVFAVMFATSGPFYFAERQTAARWLERLQNLPPAANQPAAAPAVVEGRIAADTAPLERQFAAYVFETQRGGKGSAAWWTEEASQKSAFAIDTQDGRVTLASNGYNFSPLVEPWMMSHAYFTDLIVRDWDHVARRTGLQPGSPPDKARYRGLAIAEPVIAIGRTGNAGTFEAEYVLAGTRAQLVSHLQQMAAGEHDTIAYWFTAAGIAGLLATLAGWAAYLRWTMRAASTGSGAPRNVI